MALSDVPETVAASAGKRPALRLGLVAHTHSIPEWLAHTLRKATEEGVVDVVLAVAGRPNAARVQDEPAYAYALLEVFSSVERHRRADYSYEAAVALTELAPGCALETITGASTWTHRLSAEEEARLRSHHVDVFILVAADTRASQFQALARIGALRLSGADSAQHDRSPVGLREAIESRPTTEIFVQFFSGTEPHGRVAARAVLPTVAFSPLGNAAQVHRNAGRLLLPVLERLSRQEAPYVGEAAHETVSVDEGGGTPWRPTNWNVLRNLPALISAYVRKRVSTVGTREQWFIAWNWKRAIGTTPAVDEPAEYRPMMPPRDRIWADPFVAVDAGRHWMFFEEQRFDQPNGVLAVCEMTERGPLGVPRVILEEPWHLSFPGVFKRDDQWWLLPETGDAGKVILYAAVDFPLQWRREAVLLEKRLADPVLLEHRGTWYLFGSPYEPGELPTQSLHIFVSDSMTGPFRAHPQNPISTDASHARMAGLFFASGEDLVRPAQSCVPTYGTAISLMRVITLTPTRYEEVEVRLLRADLFPGADGLHTLNAGGQLSAIDLRHRCRPI